MKAETYNNLIDKAKTKKDGVYSSTGHKYLVIDGHFVAYSEFLGGERGVGIFEGCYGFVVQIGKLDSRALDSEIKKKLLSLREEFSKRSSYY